ncbi:MAG: cyclic nucleotide-binding domain-containing protein [Deltaproteobacteria bacterium]|nr:cyclic nucleotide-binding domain-containing protein [Deltaproteobacteria bacterium]
MAKLRDVREIADQHLFAQRYREALAAYGVLVQLSPIDLDARLRVADSLLSLGEVQHSAVVYTALARYSVNAGHPLRALVAIKILATLEPQLAALIGPLAELYAEGSARLGGGGVRIAAADEEAPVPDGLDLSRAPDAPDLAARVAALASDYSALRAVPETLPPIPLFSKLPARDFAGMLAELKLVRARPEQTIIQEGERGTSFFVLARGTVRVHRHNASGGSIELARLGEGSIFGEMALVSAAPRSATVTAVTDCDLLEFDRTALAAASEQVATVAAALDRFTRERLLNNLMATSPLFRPFDRRQRFELVRRFSAHDVAAGTVLIRESEQGRGLFVILHGEVDVSKRDGEDQVLLATLRGGEVFGEISLLEDTPTTATVVAARQTNILFLPRDAFLRLVKALPELESYFRELAEERQLDARLVLERSREGGEITELSEDDLVLV